MNKYEVTFVVETTHTFKVSADSEDEATEKAGAKLQTRCDGYTFSQYLPGDPVLHTLERKR